MHLGRFQLPGIVDCHEIQYVKFGWELMLYVPVMMTFCASYNDFLLNGEASKFTMDVYGEQTKLKYPLSSTPE